MDEVVAFSVDDTVDLRRSILRGGDPAAQIIVDGDHVVIDRDARSANQDEIADRFTQELDVAAHDVVES